jgi:hypothetical protein
MKEVDFMKLITLLDVMDFTTDVEILIETSVGGTLCTALIEKGTAGEIFMNGRFDNATVEFVTYDNDIMQIIVSTDSYEN